LNAEYNSLILIALPGPEETFQPISFMTGHEVNMHMRYTLANTVINSHKSSICC